MENKAIYVVKFVTSKTREGVAVFATEEEAKNYADEKNSYYPICQKRKSFRVVKKDGTPKKWKQIKHSNQNIMRAAIKKLESSVRERKLTGREAEVELLEKYDMYDLENVLPHRRIEVTDFNHEYLCLENGECVSGEFPRQGKIYDNVEFCTDTQRFEYIEYFMKEEEE